MIFDFAIVGLVVVVLFLCFLVWGLCKACKR